MIVQYRLNVLVEDCVYLIQISRNFLGIEVYWKLLEYPRKKFKMFRVHVMVIIQKLLLSHKVFLAGLSTPFKFSKQLFTDLIELSHVILIWVLAHENIFEGNPIEVWKSFIVVGCIIWHARYCGRQDHDRKEFLFVEMFGGKTRIVALAHLA